MAFSEYLNFSCLYCLHKVSIKGVHAQKAKLHSKPKGVVFQSMYWHTVANALRLQYKPRMLESEGLRGRSFWQIS